VKRIESLDILKNWLVFTTVFMLIAECCQWVQKSQAMYMLRE
jgi:hypothetical protein